MITMTASCTARNISPMLAVADMEQTLAFYHAVLG
jgi:catechol 2,3-dioxygenase-like lactoylglutathione lyase family enzyme